MNMDGGVGSSLGYSVTPDFLNKNFWEDRFSVVAIWKSDRPDSDQPGNWVVSTRPSWLTIILHSC
jgi:hypothetical protein